MALISHLVEELAKSTGVAEKSITVIARWLREDGLLSQKGRGRGAAKATPMDAARLLIALMIDGKIKNAPQAVRDFGQLVLFSQQSSGHRQISLEMLCGLPAGHTFEEGLAALIGIWGNEGVIRAIRRRSGRLGVPPAFAASIQDDSVTGHIILGDASYHYLHPTEHRLMTEPPEQGSSDPRSKEKATISMLLYEEWSSLNEVRSRYQSGIESQRSVRPTLLRPLGEVVADLRKPGAGSQKERISSIMVLLNSEDSDA